MSKSKAHNTNNLDLFVIFVRIPHLHHLLHPPLSLQSYVQEHVDTLYIEPDFLNKD